MVFVPYQSTGTIHNRKTNALVTLLNVMYDTRYAMLVLSFLCSQMIQLSTSPSRTYRSCLSYTRFVGSVHRDLYRILVALNDCLMSILPSPPPQPSAMLLSWIAMQTPQLAIGPDHPGPSLDAGLPYSQPTHHPDPA